MFKCALAWMIPFSQLAKYFQGYFHQMLEIFPQNMEIFPYISMKIFPWKYFHQMEISPEIFR